MLFQNREEAAQLLASKLMQYQDKNALVLAIPRGAVPMADIIAQNLNAEMDVVLVHKLGAPGQPELAIGALDENGNIFINQETNQWGIQEAYFLQEKKAQMETLKRRRALYRPLRSPINPTGRLVIIVDDGIATGATMTAALRAIRAQNPSKLIAVAAVASCEAFQLMQKLADEVICLAVPEVFYAVGQFFSDFPQVSDDELIKILSSQAKKNQ